MGSFCSIGWAGGSTMGKLIVESRDDEDEEREESA